MPKNIKQIIPYGFCINCDVCCRYPERTTAFAPCFFSHEIKENASISSRLDIIGGKTDLKTPPIPYNGHYICPYFVPDKNTCSIYPLRPFDCQIYPFMVTYDKDSKSVVLALDTKCPYLADRLDSKEVGAYIDYFVDILEDEKTVEEINANKKFINDFQEDSIILKGLENLSRRLCLSEYGLRKISLKDRTLFDEYFLKSGVLLSYFSFTAIYVWSSVLNILWKKIGSALCVFAGNDRDYFLLLPPIDKTFNKNAVEESLQILSYLNEGGCLRPKIENVPDELSSDMTSMGLTLNLSSQEYIYNRKDLVELKGSGFGKKRSLINRFTKNCDYNCRPLRKKDVFSCLDLYRKWAIQKLNKEKDDYFRLLIEDTYFAQKTALFSLEHLNLCGLLIETNGNINGYTLGYPLNKDMFVILFETADLNTKGLPQFIFREFTRRLSGYSYINTQSDSGLENLKRVKESYRPIKKISIYSAFFQSYQSLFLKRRLHRYRRSISEYMHLFPISLCPL